MPLKRIITLVVGATLWASNPAAAQFALSKDGTRGVAASQVVKRRDVQKELRLTPEQVQKLRDVDERTRRMKEADFAQLAELDPKARDDKRREIVRSTNKLETDEVKKILTETQLHRLMEVTYQIAYVQAFQADGVIDALQITPEQKDRIRNIMRETIFDMRQMFQSTDEELGASREQAEKLRDKAMEDVLVVLTADQRAKWKKLQGEPFDIKMPPKPTPSVKPREDVADVAGPSNDPHDLEWVAKRVQQWQPSADERKVDRIGWADGIVPALRLAREHNRPVFVFTLDGDLAIGRC